MAGIGLPGGWTGSIGATRKGPTFKAIDRRFQKGLKEVGFAAVVALTRSAKAIKEEQPREMERVFDRPTPFTLRSVFLKPATKSEPYARVWLKDQQWSDSYDFALSRASRSGGYRVSKRIGKGTPAAKYLLPQIRGGTRDAKGFEVLMRSAGIIAGNEFIVPGAITDRYGNISQGLITKVLSDQGALRDPYSNRPGSGGRKLGRGEKPRRSRYFKAKIKGTKAIWERMAYGKIRPVMIIVKGPLLYRERYDFVGVGRRVFRQVWPGEIERAIAEGFARSKGPLK